ncbi:MAG TPA: hypothetical protein VIM79_24145 [Niastella sp.]
MKKVRIMLSAAIVMAAVGGALAFTAKADNFCLYQVDPDSNSCPRVEILQSFNGVQQGGDQTIRSIANCPGAVPIAECTFTIQNTVVD